MHRLFAPLSPDFVPSDYLVFPNFKSNLKGRSVLPRPHVIKVKRNLRHEKCVKIWSEYLK